MGAGDSIQVAFTSDDRRAAISQPDSRHRIKKHHPGHSSPTGLFGSALVTAELAQKAEIHFNKVSVRCQKTRWGSCSSRGNINLNWRLIQCPEWVRDYVIIHELHHRMHLNHSFRFWRSLHRQYKNVRQAELWLRQHSFLLDV